jgi:hypothetical protein
MDSELALSLSNGASDEEFEEKYVFMQAVFKLEGKMDDLLLIPS